MGSAASLSFPEDLRTYLEDLNISTLAQAHNPCSVDRHYWYSASDLDLGGIFESVWNDFTFELAASGIRLSDSSDKLMWSYNNKNDSISYYMLYFLL